MDILVLAYGVLQIALYVPRTRPTILSCRIHSPMICDASFYTSSTFTSFFTWLAGRVSSRELIKEAQAAFCLSCAIMARGGLRDSASLAAVHGYRSALERRCNLGSLQISRRWASRTSFYHKHIGTRLSACNWLGFWLYLESHIRSRISRFSVLFLLSLGVLATYSRGPTIGLIIIYVVVLALRPGAFTRLFKGALAALLFVILIGQSPLGDRIAHILPFMKGSADEQADSSITYRQRLAERSWELINEHPFFGDQLALQKMEDLRQGEGIIDLVNTYAAVTVFYGFVGLAIFISAMLIALSKAYRTAKKTAQKNPDLALMGISLVGCIVGTLFMLATCSFLAGYDVLFYVIAGFAATYANVANLPKPDTKAYGPVSRSPELR